jgi:hypothetical protein
MGCLCTLTLGAHQLNLTEPAPGYSSVLNKAIISCMDPNVFITKKWAEIRPGLENNPRPNPATVHGINQQQPQGHRKLVPNAQANMGPSRLGAEPGRMPGPIPRRMPGRMPRGIPRGLLGQIPRGRQGQPPAFGDFANLPQVPIRGRREAGPCRFPRGYTEPTMEDDWYDTGEFPEDDWYDGFDEDEEAYMGMGYYPGPPAYYGDPRMEGYPRSAFGPRRGSWR